VGVGTLGDYAALGVILHAYTAAVLGATSTKIGPATWATQRALSTAREQWRRLTRQLG
jgi:hypothetical protein